MELWYWVTVEDEIPFLNGHLEILSGGSKKVDGSRTYDREFRVCLEFGIPGQEELWREQVMLVADVKDAKKFTNKVTLLKEYSVKDLDEAEFFCTLNDDF